MTVILQVFLVFAAAKLAGELFAHLRLPALAGELLAGALLGPAVLGWIHPGGALDVLAQLGIVFLLFQVGLEIRPRDLGVVFWPALLASLGGMALTVLGVFAFLGFLQLGDLPALANVVVALALAASSAGVAVRVFADLGIVGSRAAKIVLGAAVIDDLVVLAVVPAILGAEEPGGLPPWLIPLLGVGFVAAVAAAGPWLVRRYAAATRRARTRRAPFIFSLVLCLGLAALAEQAGLAALVGAFLAGMALSQAPDRADLERRMEPLFDLFVPFFFVLAGTMFDPASLAGDPEGLIFVGLLLVIVVGAKVLGCGLGAGRLPLRERFVVGAGMVPRGEVTLATVAAAVAAGVLDATAFSWVVAIVFLTTLKAPFLVRLALPGRQRFGPALDGPPEAPGLDDGSGEGPSPGKDG